MRRKLEHLKIPAACMGSLLLLIGLLELLRFPQSVQNAMQSAFGPAVVLCLAAWFGRELLEVWREHAARSRREAVFLQTAAAAARAAADLKAGAAGVPSSFGEWLACLAQLRVLGSPDVLGKALILHERLAALACEFDVLTSERATLEQLRDSDLLRVSKIPPDQSEEQEMLLLRAVRMHEEARRVLERQVQIEPSEDLMEAQLGLFEAMRGELGGSGITSAADSKLLELAAAAREARRASESNLRSLLAPRARASRTR